MATMLERADFESWEKLEKVGSGGFGEVWKVSTDDGTVLAAKYINLVSVQEVDRKMVQKEISILSQLGHKNVVQFVTARREGSNLIVFTELIDGRDLGNIVKLGPLEEPRGVDFLRQICEGLHYLHTCKPPVLHRDLKGENIMVTQDETIKIIDFGLSMHLLVASGMKTTDVIMTNATFCGTMAFMAPELLKDKSFSVKTDVWALGITVYQMMAGNVSFASSFTASNLTDIVNRYKQDGAPQLPPGCSQQLVEFYKRCTAYKPKKRLSVRKLLKLDVFSI